MMSGEQQKQVYFPMLAMGLREGFPPRAFQVARREAVGGEPMSKIIAAVYEHGVFRPLEPVVLPEGEHVQVRVPERLPTQRERLAALETFEAMREELTEEQWGVFEEAGQRRPWFGGRQLDL
jgi:predicted DNA-binding antitoxin AbrB/MazE fold protein